MGGNRNAGSVASAIQLGPEGTPPQSHCLAEADAREKELNYSPQQARRIAESCTACHLRWGWASRLLPCSGSIAGNLEERRQLTQSALHRRHFCRLDNGFQFRDFLVGQFGEELLALPRRKPAPILRTKLDEEAG